MARFVGQDRGLKRLSLLRVADVPLVAASIVHPGDPVDDARARALADPQRYVLVTDATSQPLGWIAARDIPAEGRISPEMANPVSPTMNKRTTLKDALSMMLDAEVQTGIVVDRTGAVQGLVTVSAVAEKMREGEHAPAFDQLPGETGEVEAGVDPDDRDADLAPAATPADEADLRGAAV